jgi:hypothetical protein
MKRNKWLIVALLPVFITALTGQAVRNLYGVQCSFRYATSLDGTDILSFRNVFHYYMCIIHYFLIKFITS